MPRRRPTVVRRALAVVVVVVVATVLAACSDDGDTVTAGDDPGTTPSTSAEPPTTAGTAPDRADGIAIQIRTGGGFVPQELAFATVPEVTLYADGRIIATGPTTLEYPGKALPNVLAGSVDDSAVRAAVTAAREAGVTDEPELGRPSVADAPTTTFLLVDGGRTYRLDAYAIDFEDGPGLTAAQQEARRRLRGLVRRLQDLAAAADRPYRATAVSVLVTPYPEPEPGRAPVEPVPGEADWPLDDLGGGGEEQFGGRCLGFTGPDAERVLAAAGEARSNTRWRSGGRTWALAFRPELPGGEPCADR